MEFTMEFTERMEAGKLTAMRNRNRGQHTGKVAKGWNVKRRHDDEGTWHAALYVARNGWELAKLESAQFYATQVFPERYEDLEF